MKNIIRIVAMTGCMIGTLNASNFDVRVSGSEKGISGFTFSIGDYYHVPVQDVVVIERSIPRDEMSVVYFLAKNSHRDARYISDLRLRGDSWWNISLRLGLDPHTLFVVDSRRNFGPPYGNAYGYSKEKKHRLRDTEIIDLVNTRFIADYHHISPDEVIERRRGGEHYMKIDEHYRGKKSQHANESSSVWERKNDKHHDKGHGNSKGNGRD